MKLLKGILNADLKFSQSNFNFKQVAKVIAIFIIAATIALIWLVSWVVLLGIFDEQEDYSWGQDSQVIACNVEGIGLRGTLVSYISPAFLDDQGYPLEDYTASETVVYWIDQAAKDDSVKAIILEIDSYGGYPVAAGEVAEALKRTQKPTVALIREGGVSAAYWAATGADLIFASKNSDVGSLGISMSYLDFSRQNQLAGLSYVQLSSGKFKDTGDPNKPLTAEERVLLMRDVDIIHQNFIEAVSENRKLDVQKVSQLADGSTMLGEMALANGLIDKIGGIAEVRAYLQELLGEEVEICW